MNHSYYGAFNKHKTLVLCHKLAADKPLALGAQSQGYQCKLALNSYLGCIFVKYTTSHGLHIIYTYTHTYTLMHTHTCACTYTYICTHRCVHACTHTHMNTDTLTHTDTDRHTQSIQHCIAYSKHTVMASSFNFHKLQHQDLAMMYQSQRPMANKAPLFSHINIYQCLSTSLFPHI